MSIPAFLSGREQHRACARRVWRMSVWICFLMLAIAPAAYAHEEDERPTPEAVWWSLLCFGVILAYLLAACLRAPYKARPRFQPRRIAPLKARRRPQHAQSFWTASFWKNAGHRAISLLTRGITSDLRQHPGRPRPLWARRPKTPKTSKKP